MLNAQQVDALQNAEPTDFAKLDRDLATRADYNSARFAGDAFLHVEFFMHPLMNEEKSAAAGRPIYEDMEFVRIMMPGDKHNILVRVADPMDKERFASHYERFKRGAAQVVGTPLHLCGFLTAAQVQEYKHFGLRTVEQMAEAADTLAGTFMGFYDHKAKARRWLDKQGSSEALLAQIDELKARVQNSEAQLSRIAEQRGLGQVASELTGSFGALQGTGVKTAQSETPMAQPGPGLQKVRRPLI